METKIPCLPAGRPLFLEIKVKNKNKAKVITPNEIAKYKFTEIKRAQKHPEQKSETNCVKNLIAHWKKSNYYKPASLV